LQQNAGSVAGIFLAPAGSAVSKVQQHLQALLNDIVGAAAPQIDHKTDPARVTLPLRIV
jgi:hypothetical protein